mmetsp:Transcript_49514/g.149218  ORF Transcript_49514/g.149218 Transcript_49514/m.149218 type:complete len:613 (-) Transcript_49514:406-2244(-)
MSRCVYPLRSASFRYKCLLLYFYPFVDTDFTFGCSSTCPLLILAPEQPRTVTLMTQTPRFGRSSQFSKLFSFSNEEQTDYAMGLIFITAFVFTVFFLWTVSIFVFMCLGQREAGFLSGYPFLEPEPEVDEYQQPKPFKRPRRIRFTFLVCNILVIMFSVLFVTEGIKNLQATTNSFSESTKQVNSLASSSYSIADDLHDVGTSTAPVRDFLVSKLGNFCPNDPNLEEHTGVDFDAIASTAVEKLELLKNFVDNDVVDFRDYVGQVEDSSHEVDTALNSYDVSEWKVMLYVLPMIILPSFLLIGLFMAWFNVSFKEYQCLLRYLIFPLFGIVVVLSWVFCSLFGFVSVTNADFCSGGEASQVSPEGTFMDILAEQDLTSDSIIYRSIEYYVRGCSTSFPFSFIDTYKNDLEIALNATADFSLSIDAVGVSELNELCGSDFSDVASNLNVVETNLDKLLRSAARGLELISCESIRPLYETTFHDGLCMYSVSGFTWVFSSLLVISFCGMLMITFRSAVYDIIWWEDQDGTKAYEGSKEAEKEKFYDDEDENEQFGHNDPGVYDENAGEHYDDQDRGMEGTAPMEGTGGWDNYPNDFAQDQGDASYSPGQSGRDW